MDIIETKRLVLRRQTTEDAQFILGLMNDPEWIRYIGDRGVGTLDEAQAYIKDGAMTMYSQHGMGLYLVELKNDRTPIGICGLIKRESMDDIDLGFALERNFRGQGYAHEAAAATIDYGRDELGLDRIVGIVSSDNTKSIHLLEKLGFRFEQMMDDPNGNKVQLFALAL